MEWKYLLSEPFYARHVLTAHYVHECETVVEVGPYRNSLLPFLPDVRKYIGVGPFEKEAGAHLSRRAEFHYQPIQEVDLPLHGFGLVALGMHLEGPGALEQMVRWVNKSAVTVIEFPPDFQPSVDQFNAIVAATQRRIAVQIGLDFTGNDFGDLSNSWHARPHRRLYVLR